MGDDLDTHHLQYYCGVDHPTPGDAESDRIRVIREIVIVYWMIEIIQWDMHVIEGWMCVCVRERVFRMVVFGSRFKVLAKDRL